MRLLVGLHLLLLLSVLLFHLLSLLLMLLFHLLLHLLFPGSVLILFLRLLMFLVLFLLKFLVILDLLVVQLLLLLLVFLILFCISGVGRRWSLVRLQIVRMNWMSIYIGVAICGSLIVGRSRWRIVIPPRSCRYYSAFVKGRRLWRGGDRRFAMIHRSAHFLVVARRLEMLSLRGDRRNVMLTRSRFLLRSGASVDAALTTVVADARRVVVVHHRGVVHVVNLRHVHVIHRTVVIEVVVVPASSLITAPEIAVSIIDATVKSHDRSPIACVKKISTAAPSPPARRPQEANLRRHHPRAWNPIVVINIAVPCPVAWRPDIPVPRADRLLVHGQFRRRKAHRNANADLREGCARNREHR